VPKEVPVPPKSPDDSGYCPQPDCGPVPSRGAEADGSRTACYSGNAEGGLPSRPGWDDVLQAASRSSWEAQEHIPILETRSEYSGISVVQLSHIQEPHFDLRELKMDPSSSFPARGASLIGGPPPPHVDDSGSIGFVATWVALLLILFASLDMGKMFMDSDVLAFKTVQNLLECAYLIIFCLVLIIVNIPISPVTLPVHKFVFTNLRFLAGLFGRACLCFHISCRASSSHPNPFVSMCYVFLSMALAGVGISFILMRTYRTYKVQSWRSSVSRVSGVSHH